MSKLGETEQGILHVVDFRDATTGKLFDSTNCVESLKLNNCNDTNKQHVNVIEISAASSASKTVDNYLCSNAIDIDNNINKVDNSAALAAIHVVNSSRKPYLSVKINGAPLKMELDTGSTLTCISKHTFEALNLRQCKLVTCNESLRVANYDSVLAPYKASVRVEFRNDTWVLPLYIVDCKFPTLLGREWITTMFGTDWLDRIVNSTDSPQLNFVSEASKEAFVARIKQSKVFDNGVGEVVNFEACLDLKPDSRPKFCKARPVPFAVKGRLEEALDKLVATGQLVPVEHSEYASPVVPVIKEDGTIRVCGDYKATVNGNLDTAVYPLPAIEDCLSELVGGQLFTKLDIKQAFNNLKLRESDRELVTLNTHKGLFAPTRLPYEISSATAIFQRKMDQVLLGVPGVACRVDDIVITGPDDETHMERLEELITRLKNAGFRCRADKCRFMVESVVYLGYEISRAGVKPL